MFHDAYLNMEDMLKDQKLLSQYICLELWREKNCQSKCMPLFSLFLLKPSSLINHSLIVQLCHCATCSLHFVSFCDRFLLHSLLRLQISSRPAVVGRETHLKLVTARQLLVLVARFVRSPHT